MNTRARLALLSVVVVLASVPAFGEDAASVSSREQDVSGPPGMRPGDFSWSVGFGLLASPRPYRGTSAKLFPVPVLNVRYKGAFLQGIRGGFDLVREEKLSASVFAQPRFRGLEPEDSPYLAGMTERRMSLDAGAEVIYRGRPLGFRASVVSDVLGRSKGQEVSLLAVTGAPLGKLGRVLVGFGPRWLSTNRVDYYYGVRAEEARADRPAYRGRETWNLDLNVTTILNVAPRLSLFVLFNREQLGSAIEDSPLVERSSAYSLVTSLTYRF